MSTKTRITKAEKTARPRSQVVGYSEPEAPDLVTVNGSTISRAEWERLHPEGLLIVVQYADAVPV